METQEALFLGKTIGAYHLQEFVGRGSTTAVYRAYSEDQQDIPHALVTFLLAPDHLSPAALERFQDRFEREAGQVAALRFPSLLSISDYGTWEDYPYVIIPSVPGETLAAHLKQNRRFQPMQALSMLLPVTAALSFLSDRGVFFRFFDPSQVLILENGDALLLGLSFPHMLRLMGLEERNEQEAAVADVHLKNIAGTYAGAPEYLAPEVVRGAAPDIRSAIYSLGAMLFAMFGGRPPFTGQRYMEIARKHLTAPLPSLHALAPEAPLALELVINHALQRSADQRFQTPADLLNAYIHMLDTLEKRSRALRASRPAWSAAPGHLALTELSGVPSSPSLSCREEDGKSEPDQAAETPSELGVIIPAPLPRPHEKIALSDGPVPPL